MTEIFTDIPQAVKDQAKFWADIAFKQNSVFDAAEMMASYAKTCSNEEEKKFVDFYFTMRLEELKNGNNSNIW